ncbi:response regulator transcription factor [Granulicella sp. S156]|jgi:DNA-binding response OmpR family regulator|uniref:response regulator transcription factor n=1 Tax=Granulicella sp. S156 TaxID=1747224 RepID=UPI00131CFA2D|nr:response regulator transcription factor [Granulicella sp. S156]
MRVLIVEDETRIAHNVATALREGSGFAVDCSDNGTDGATLAGQGHYDLLLLDLMLPGMDGLGIVRQVRARGDATPILVLTARSERANVIQLLNAGADDYLTKPFDLGELLARVKALIRRGKGVAHPVVAIGRLSINSIEQTVRCDGQLIDLSPTEYRIFEYLIFRPRAIVSKRELLEHLYDYRWEHHSNVIEAHVSNLRKKLRVMGEEATVETLRGRGYRLYAPEKEA